MLKGKILLPLFGVVMVLAVLKLTYLKDVDVVQTVQRDHSEGNVLKKPKEPKQGSCGPFPSQDVLDTLTHEHVAQHYHNYVNSVQFHCKNVVRYGNVADGGWDVCADSPFNIQKPCIVYSFGINNEWSFDDSIALKCGCEVHSYDPSMKVDDHDRKPNLHFHRTGLNTTDGINQFGWKMLTLKSILKANGHSTATIDLLKIDIDFSEWWAFPEMIKSGALKNVKQLCFEIHIKLKTQPEPDKAMYMSGLKLLRDFYADGFRIFRTHKNMDAKYKSVYGMERTGCHELYMVRNDTKTYG